MEFNVYFYPDGKTVRFQLADQPAVKKVTAGELKKRLHSPGIGEDLGTSLAAVQGIIARLLERPDFPDDVTHTLRLIEQASKHTFMAQVVESELDVQDSDYRRQVLSMQLMLGGQVPVGKRDVRVHDGIFQEVVIRLVESRHAALVAVPSEHRVAVAEAVAKEIFFLVGRTPAVTLTLEALEVAGRKGRPKGRRNGALSARGKNEVYNDLLREIGLQSASVEGLKKQRKRGGRRRDA